MDRLNRRQFISITALSSAGLLVCGCGEENKASTKFAKAILKTLPAERKFNPARLTPKPPLGFNSYDCYGGGTYANEENILANMEVFAKKLKPHGYKYFVIDAGWFINSDDRWIEVDEYGRILPAKTNFPNGLEPIIKRAHKLKIKFGVWMVRGVNRQAVDRKLKIKGSNYTVADIADKKNICSWCEYNYGVNMKHPAAQKYYDSVLELLAEWGLDFVKYDDIEEHPAEIEAVARAINNSKRDIVFSISPGNNVNPDYRTSYRMANMVRVSGDIWDNRESIEKTFQRWELMQKFGGRGFWIDLDMIPFGTLMVHNKEKTRTDNFTTDQRYTFITQRALAASPLIMGGELTTTSDEIFDIITNKEMLKCNQNAVTGKLIARGDNIDIWKTKHKKKQDQGWIGIFNRNQTATKFSATKEQLKLNPERKYSFYDIWNKKKIKNADTYQFDIGPDGVVFLKY